MNAKSSFVTVSCLAVAALALVSHQRGEAEAPARAPVLSKAEADGIIFERQQIPAGTRSWLAFSAGDTLVGVYLLEARSVEDPAILEEIMLAAE